MVSRSPGIGMAQSCAQATVWVKENYELHQDGVVAKSVIYKHYEDYCNDHGRATMETSIFGRVVKQVFPDVQIRRLGGRDNLKYYYCGIQAKATSPYVNDNTNTIRPQRKQRKRGIVADKAEEQRCLKWLYCHYEYDRISSLRKAELYHHYAQDNFSSPLSMQDFTYVALSGFSKLSKRKLSLKASQQDVFVGFRRRIEPLDSSVFQLDDLSPMSEMHHSPSNPTYYSLREGSHTPDEDDDECGSPESEEGSDMSAGGGQSYMDIKTELNYQDYSNDEPLDFTMNSRMIKPEPLDDDIKEEKFPIDDGGCYRSSTPEGPSASMMDSPTPSPSPPQKSTRPKVYKPRIHGSIQPESKWNMLPDEEESSAYSCNMAEQKLREWLQRNLCRSDNSKIDRDQLYACYCQSLEKDVPPPIAHFDKVVFTCFPGTATVMHSHGTTLYKGVAISRFSFLYIGINEEQSLGQLDDFTDHHQWNTDVERPMDTDLPLQDDRNSPFITLEDDGELEGDESDIFKDGKSYLKSWLKQNFEEAREACILKADTYKFYEDFARENGHPAYENNVFGKIVKKVFPSVSVRRLGGRQKPQYHYCGITPKPTSKLYHLLSGKDPAQRSRKKEITDNETNDRVIEWLRNSYQYRKDSIVNKTDVYNNYVEYCNNYSIECVNVNYFGKLFKRCFPEVDVRKGGGRTEPTLYYYGLEAKDPSLRSSNMDELSQTSVSHQHAAGSASQILFTHVFRTTQPSHPISVPMGASNSVFTSAYGSGSPNVLSAPYSINSSYLSDVSQRTSPYLNTPSSGLDDPRSNGLDSCPPSPELSRAFQVRLRTDGQRPNQVMSPDMAPDIHPKSPEGSSLAQNSHSPSASYYPTIDNTNALLANSGVYVTPGIVIPSSSPNIRKGASHISISGHTPTMSPFGSYGPSHLLAQDGGPNGPPYYLPVKLKQQVTSESLMNPFSGRS